MKRIFGAFILALIVLFLVSASAFADSLNLVSSETGYSSIYDNVKKIRAGQSTTLTVTASGDVDGISYRWYRYDSNWSNYEELAFTDTTLDTGALYNKYFYYCEATNSSGYSATCGFTVQIDNNFYLETEDGTSSSATVTVAEGSSTTLKVKVLGDDLSKVSYQWRRYTLSGENEETLTETSSTLVIPKVNNSYVYYCYGEDGFGNTDSVSYTVKVENHFSVTVNGSDSTWNVPVYAPYGENAVLSVTPHGDNLKGVTYRWYKYKAYTWGDYKAWDDSAATLTTDPVTESYYYYCDAMDRFGNQAHASFLVSVENHFSLVCDGSGTQEENVTLSPGGSTVLKVRASGDDLSTVTYSWSRYKSGGNTETLAETGAALTTGVLNATYYYQCTATDKYGNRETCSFNVRIENHFSAVPVGVGSNNSVTVEKGSSATLKVNVQGDDLDGVTYHWSRYASNGEEYANLTETSAMLNTGTLDRAYNYNCYVTDKYGNTGYCYFNVKIDNHFSLRPSINGVNINSAAVPFGSSATIGVLASADDPTGITYHWSRYSPSGNGDNIALNDTSATITTGALDRAYNYQCRAVDRYGNTEWCMIYVQIENHFSLVDENTGSRYWDNNERFIAPGGATVMTVVACADDTAGITYQLTRYSQDGNGDWYDQTVLGTSPSQATGAQNQTYYYRCDATDKYGNEASCYYRVSIQNNLSVVSTETGGKYQDSNRIYVEKGQTATLSVLVTGDDLSGLTYQWFAGPSQYNSGMEVIDGATNSVTTEPVNGMKYYRCVVTDRYGTTEYCVFSVCVQNNLKVVTESGSMAANVLLTKNQTRSLTAVATADDLSGITYQWYKAPQKAFNNDASGWVACGSSAAITSDPASSAMMYRCEVTDRYGTVAQCWYYVGIQNHFGLSPVTGTRTSDGTSSVLVAEGQTATLQVEAYGDDLNGVTYEWREAIHIWENGGVQYGEPISGATGPSLTTPAVGGYKLYRVWATDRYGNISNFGFDVSVSNGVTVAPVTDRFPVVPRGSSTTMTVSVTGNANLSYQWYTTENGSRERIAGVTGASCTRTINKNCNIIFTATDEYGMSYSVIFVPSTTEFTQIKPLLKSVTSTSGGVILEWDAIDGAAVVWVQRMASGESDWTDLGSISNSLTYCDTTAVNKTTYSYRIVGGFSGAHKTQMSDVRTISHRIVISRDKILQLPEGLTRIESEAFVNVSAEAVLIPATVTYIADDAFSDVVIIGDSGKAAEQYADSKKLTFITRAEYNTWP